MTAPYWLTNIRLETGYQQDEKGVYETKTSLFHLKIEDGKFVEKKDTTFVIPSGETKIDGKGSPLLFPISFTIEYPFEGLKKNLKAVCSLIA